MRPDDQPQSLDPGQSQYTFETAVLRVIGEPLLKSAPDLSGVVPAAAASYDVTEGGTRYVFHLRKDAQYWDGQAVKAKHGPDYYAQIGRKGGSAKKKSAAA